MRYERVFRYNILRAIRWSTTAVPSIFAHTKSLNVPPTVPGCMHTSFVQFVDHHKLLACCIGVWVAGACVVLFGVSVGSVVA
jgi:hypothetical protein